ncbi:MAG: C39 family peptidase [Eubacteriales bacterium]|nr:C39 family peptidase [Eubacteriales bacterium]
MKKRLVNKTRKRGAVAAVIAVILLTIFIVVWVLLSKEADAGSRDKNVVVSVEEVKPTETITVAENSSKNIEETKDAAEFETADAYSAGKNEDFVANSLTGKTFFSEGKEYVYADSYFNEGAVLNNSARLDVSPLLQLPQLPTGCEVTALTTVLNHLGYPVSKGTMADYYLPKCNPGEGSFRDYFIGNPRDENSFGCFAGPITAAANSYLSQNGGDYYAKNISGSDFSMLLNYVAEGTPVVVWSTMYMEQAYLTAAWYVDGEEIRWIAQEHCMVLTGYDMSAGTVTVSDPLIGIVNYDLELFVERHKEMLSQAVVIEKNL